MKGFIASGIFFVGLILFVRFDVFEKVGDDHIQLSNTCPPGFELTGENKCMARNLYMMYSSINDQGVGGLKTALPAVRDGFTPQQIDLGRYLFFDPVLSADGTISCASCHDPDKGLSDGLGQSVGIHNDILPRSAPSLWNVAYFKSFFWDARATSLEEQMQGPLFNEHEMGSNPELLVKTLNEIEEYRHLFSVAFPKRKSHEVKLEDIFTSIAAFESSLISLNSRYDQYAHGYAQALNQKEIEGLNVFRSFVARCAECHTPPLFTNQQIAVLGTPDLEGMPFDPGAEVPYNDATMRGGFKVPSLRNIEKTAPYMHSGKFETLRETVQFYNDGRGHAIPEGEKIYLHWHIWEPNLSDYELDRIVDFLKTLTDESFKPQVPDVLPSGSITDLVN
jgi:cytochrome c peroxidase